MPVLLEHESKEIVGFTEKVEINAKNIKVAGIVSDQETGRKVASMADEGFPWQLSVRIYHDTVSFVGEGDKVLVNGSTHKGPIAVLRDCNIREVSFCALAADRKTVANVFNLKEIDMSTENVPKTESAGARDLTLQTLTDEMNQFKAQADDVKTKLAAQLSENAELKGKLQSLKFENRTLNDSLASARKEAVEFRAKYVDTTRSTRLAILENDYKGAGIEFKM
jgi:regulator of replication initiation timing